MRLILFYHLFYFGHKISVVEILLHNAYLFIAFSNMFIWQVVVAIRFRIYRYNYFDISK